MIRFLYDLLTFAPAWRAGVRATFDGVPLALGAMLALFGLSTLFAQDSYLVHGRVEADYKTSPSFSGSGCNGGAYTALFDVQMIRDQTTSSAANWAQLVQNIENDVQHGGAPFSNDAGAVRGTVQLSGGCTGSYTVDPSSFWYVEYDKNGSWYFKFSYLLVGSDLNGGIAFDAVTVTTEAVAGSTITNDPKNSSNLTAATICLASSPTLLCLSGLPIITSASATSVPAGSAGFTLTLSGSNFASGAVAQWTENGQTTNLVTQVVNSGMITAQVPATLLAAPGTAQIAVTNPGGQPSLATTITITGSSAPSLTVLHDVISDSNGLATGACIAPPQVSSFTAASSQAWLYFDVNGAITGDTARITFVRPDGAVYATFSASVMPSNSAGYACVSNNIALAGTAALSYPGIWTAQVFWNQSTTPLFTLNFTLTTVVVTSALTSNSNGLAGGVCNAPPAITNFLPSAPQVWVYFTVTNANPGDPVTINFVRPDGSIHESISTAPLYAHDCFSYDISVSGTSAASYMGAWRIDVFWNKASAPLFSLYFNIASQSGGGSGMQTYYFPHLAVGGGFQSTLTLVNYSPNTVNCQTGFYSDSGAQLNIPFSGGATSMRNDSLAPGADLHIETAASSSTPLLSGWAQAQCSGPVKASLLYRFYNASGAAQGEAGVNAVTQPATEFVTFAESQTGVAYANPSLSTATVTITALNGAGKKLNSSTFTLQPKMHGAVNVGPALSLSSFSGSVQITSTVPIVSLSLNAEDFPVFSSLPPGDLPTGTPLATGVEGSVAAASQSSNLYYFPHLATGGGFQTSLTVVNYSQQTVSCQTTFYSDSGAFLQIPFSDGVFETRTDSLAPGASIHVQTVSTAALISGWAQAQCTGAVKASLLYRFYTPAGTPQGEAGVNATTLPSTEFVTFAQGQTGVAFANPSVIGATITITALDATGKKIGVSNFELPPKTHTAINIGPALGLSSFTGSIQITSTVPIVSLSLNAEAFPVFSSLPPGDLPDGSSIAGK